MNKQEKSTITDEQLDEMLVNLTKTDGSFAVDELKQKIKDQEIYIVGLKYKIEQLKYKLNNFESIQREKCCECCQKAIVDYADVEYKFFELKEKIKELIK